MVERKVRDVQKRRESMVQRIKDRIAKSGKGIGNFIRVRAGSKIKIRFVSEFGDAVLIKEHDKWGALSPTPCLKYHFDKVCEFCKIPDVRTRDIFAWTVYDYEAHKRKIINEGMLPLSSLKFQPTGLF